jgi:hypothetical protein
MSYTVFAFSNPIELAEQEEKVDQEPEYPISCLSSLLELLLELFIFVFLICLF